MASTWWPSRSSSRATDEPNRPRPMTTTCSPAIPASNYPGSLSLTDADRLDRRTIRDGPRPRRQREHQGKRSEAADEHRERDDEACGVGLDRGYVGGRSPNAAGETKRVTI